MPDDDGEEHDRARRYGEFARREEALLKTIAEGREIKMASLARALVLDTIDQVRHRIEARPDRNGRGERLKG